MLSYNHGFGVWLSGIIAVKRPKIISSPDTNEGARQLSKPLGNQPFRKEFHSLFSLNYMHQGDP